MTVLGIDLVSSSVKLSIFDTEIGKNIASSQYPKQEMKIISSHPDWAEQHPEEWWENIKKGLEELKNKGINLSEIHAIGITYQMHGLVCVDKEKNIVRPSIIWCDSRAVDIGNQAFEDIGKNKCLSTLMNSPGNFTASKLKWVIDNEPNIFEKIDKVMLPGDYVAMKLTGEINTTVTGLSEGMFWDFPNEILADFLLNHYNIPKELIPDIVPTFGSQGEISPQIADELGFKKGTPITYRAGDQPNNAYSLNVLEPGEIAATAGTSGVVYGITDTYSYDPLSRVNIFAHVNHTQKNPRLGVLLCINGTGILISWMQKNTGNKPHSYEEMNQLAEKIDIGSNGLSIIPFGNGAERVIENKNPGGQINNLNFNIHTEAHLYRASQEGIAYAFKYGIDIMGRETGVDIKTIRAGHANMFLSKVFRDTLASTLNVAIDLYDTDGSEGACRGAAVGSKAYASFEEAFSTLNKIETIEPKAKNTDKQTIAYNTWLSYLEKTIQ